ncbi:MAG: hypothetical protein GVY16_07085 [Planctomycetes bacterium]|jgi:hypothetical protein|nr:hypothetical protein [Planctomycetota bacterium]
MLGRLRRTTRLDVGLALTFSGLSFLVWSLVAGASRTIMKDLIHSTTVAHMQLPDVTRAVKVFFVDTGFAIDLVGLGWLAISLALIVFASRQRITISWAWTFAVLQSFMAALGGVLVGMAAYAPYAPAAAPPGDTTLETISQLSLPLVIAVAVLLWVTCLVWLLVDRSRLDRHGPTLTDGLRSHR